tara:strand:+ start:3290 stop:4051 length:762 start_codon:yes stop_codon:yes gene_type:complete
MASKKPFLIKKILVSQPKPKDRISPYSELEKKFKLKVKLQPFIEIEGLSVRDIRLQKINIMSFSAIIFNSRLSIDHFFRICEQMRITIPNTMKYFCVSEAVSYYLQKYTTYRKRKIYVAAKTFSDLVEIMKKHESEKFLFPGAEKINTKFTSLLDESNINYTRAVFFKTIPKKLNVKTLPHNMLVFFSPIGIESLFFNFPDFEQNNIKIAVFGETTKKMADKFNLNVDLQVPNSKHLSMISALNEYLKNAKKK